MDDNFELVNQSLCLRKMICFTLSRSYFGSFFYLTQHAQAEIHSSTLRQLQIALESLTQKLCDIPEAREKFIRLFNQPKAIQRAFLPMHQYGVLTAYLPQWRELKV